MNKTFKILFGTLTLIIFSHTSFAKEPISTEKFRDIVIAKINKEFPKACVKPKDAWTILMGETKENCDNIMINIDHSYGLYLSNINDLPNLTDNLAHLAAKSLETSSGPDPKYKKEQLAIVLRHKDYVEFLSKNDGKDRNIWKPFIGDLIALMIFDDVKTIKTVAMSEISNLKLDEEIAWKIASNNVRNNIGELDKDDIQSLTHIYAQSGFATGLLWLPEACIDGKENYLAMVISRDSYIYANMNDKNARAALLNLGGSLVIAEDTLSDNILHCEDGTWHALSLSQKDNAWVPIK